MAAGEEINDAVLYIAGSEIDKVVYFNLGCQGLDTESLRPFLHKKAPLATEHAGEEKDFEISCNSSSSSQERQIEPPFGFQRKDVENTKYSEQEKHFEVSCNSEVEHNGTFVFNNPLLFKKGK